MWDDEINKKIKDAADQYHPAYDEDAWSKMELLLDQHLPVEKKRRRKYFLIPVVSLLIGALLFFIFYNKNNLSKNLPKIETKNSITTQPTVQQKQTAIASSSEDNKPIVPLNTISPSANKKINSLQKNQDSKMFASKPTKANPLPATVSIETENASANNSHKKLSSSDKEKNTVKENTPPASNAIVDNQQEIKQPIIKAKKDSTNTDKDVAKTSTSKNLFAKKKTTTHASFKNNFGFSISAGPDVSSVGLDKTGRIAINFGIGINYALSQKFTLRTGFYKSEKIYSANKNQYTIPPGGAPNIEYLNNIGANCKVYEIPFTLLYSFSKTKNHQWFASAGLSSYLMKKESYNYNYKYPSGATYTKSWSISNQNQHYFSILDLSAGYEYSLSNRTSLLAEPYVKIPMSGIGAGKVKLNSAGILFSLTVKPFYKK